MFDLSDKKNVEKFVSANNEAISYIKNKQYNLAYEMLTNLCDVYNVWMKQCGKIDFLTIEIYNYMKCVYFNLGFIYASVDSNYYDLDKALDLYETSGNLGCSDGYYQIATIYDPNFEVGKNENIKDIGKAKQWYKKAIELDGDRYSLNNLGVLYGTEGDYKLGAFYCWLAYQLKDVAALNNYNACKAYLVEDVKEYIESLTNVSGDNIEELTEGYLAFCGGLRSIYNRKTKQHQQGSKSNAIKWGVVIAVLMFCVLFLVLIIKI